MNFETSWWLLALFCCVGVSAIAGDCTSVEGMETGLDLDVRGIVDGLPWKLDCSSTPVTGEKEQVSAAVRYDFVSVDPVQAAPRGVRLRADLTVTQYTVEGAAVGAWSAIQQAADPDMGLSYAWDYAVLEAGIIYHLHAGCVMSEHNFDRMVDNLRKQLPGGQGEVRKRLRCRCGGGCRAHD